MVEIKRESGKDAKNEQAYQKMKEEFESTRRKFKAKKTEKQQAQTVFSLDDTYKLDDPLLSTKDRENQKNINDNMNRMQKLGKESEMKAANTMGELYRNRTTMTATSDRVGRC